MKDQTITEYKNMLAFCETTLREHFGMKADPFKVIGLAKEIGMHDLANDLKEQLNENKELEETKREYLAPYGLKTFGGR